MTRLVRARREHVPGLVRLLHEKMNRKLSPESWQRLFDYEWLEPKPDYGVAAVADSAALDESPQGASAAAEHREACGVASREAPGAMSEKATGTTAREVAGGMAQEVVGGMAQEVVGAHVHVYADRLVRDVTGQERTVRFANLSSWYVDKAHRGGGTGAGMVRMAASMPGVVCTVFSLSRLRVEFYRGLGLDVLEEARLVWSRSPGWRIVQAGADEMSPAGAANKVSGVYDLGQGGLFVQTCAETLGSAGTGSSKTESSKTGFSQTEPSQTPPSRASLAPVSIEQDPQVIAARVNPGERRVLADMVPYAVTPALAECDGEQCLLYLSIRPKGDDVLFFDVLRCTNQPFLARHAQAIADRVLPADRPAVLAADSRFVPGDSAGSTRFPLQSPRFYTPGIVPPQEVDMLYCELQLLGLKLA